ncbi:MAG: acyloxyacyl hydrolase [Flavobacteriaceae bacterium]
MKIKQIILLLFIATQTYAQQKSYLDIESFYGIVIEHDKSLKTAIQGNPYGLIMGYNIKKNTASKDWLSYYNYPDIGFSALYQNTNSTILGEMYGVYSHYNFYLNDRNALNKLQLRVALGLGYITNPYDELTNPNNFTLSSKLSGSSYLKLNYHRDFYKGKIGIQAGVSLIHFSNAAFKNPNLGINTIAATIGVNYNLHEEKLTYPIPRKVILEENPLRYSLVFRAGFNESKIPNSGQFPFYVFTFLSEKKLNYKSTINIGADYFKSGFLNNYLQDVKELETGNPDSSHYKTDRIGIFVGHDWHINKLDLITQIGYTVYEPNRYVSSIYERIGIKHRFNDHLYSTLTLKLNLFRAEGLEFGIGYRL